MTLPTNRTTGNTAAEHVADHNTLHGQHNDLDGHAADTTTVHGIADTSLLALTSHTHSGAYVAATGTTTGAPVVEPTTAATVPLTLKGAASQTAALQLWTNTGGTPLAKIDAAGKISTDGWNGVSGATPSALFVGPSNTSTVGVIVRALAAQTANLQEWQNSSSVALAKVSPSGTITPLVCATGARPAAATAGAGAMYYDTTLSKPGWSDGTAWRDAAGTAI